MAVTNDLNDVNDSIRYEVEADGTLTISLIGELDMSNTEVVRTELERIVATSTGRIVLDLAGLEFIDSSGLAALLHVAKSRGTITVRNASPIVRRIIDVTGLNDILTSET